MKSKMIYKNTGCHRLSYSTISVLTYTWYADFADVQGCVLSSFIILKRNRNVLSHQLTNKSFQWELATNENKGYGRSFVRRESGLWPVAMASILLPPAARDHDTCSCNNVSRLQLSKYFPLSSETLLISCINHHILLSLFSISPNIRSISFLLNVPISFCVAQKVIWCWRLVIFRMWYSD